VKSFDTTTFYRLLLESIEPHGVFFSNLERNKEYTLTRDCLIHHYLWNIPETSRSSFDAQRKRTTRRGRY